jgi:hypothetical protein
MDATANHRVSPLEAPLRSPVRVTTKLKGVVSLLPSGRYASIAVIAKPGAGGEWSFRTVPVAVALPRTALLALTSLTTKPSSDSTAVSAAMVMVIHLVGETGMADTIGAGHGADVNRFAFQETDALPGDEHTGLTVSNIARVGADQAQALRDQQMFAGWRVVHVLRNLGHDLARLPGVDPGNQRSRTAAWRF